MYILRQERPQGVNYGRDDDMFSAEDLPICINCKHSEQNISYPKDEFDCRKTGGICNALCTCDCFEEDC